MESPGCPLLGEGNGLSAELPALPGGSEKAVSNTLEMSTEGPGKVDCSLVKYLILSPLMKGDVILDERFMQREEANGGGEREGKEACGEREGPAGSLSPCYPSTMPV